MPSIVQCFVEFPTPPGRTAPFTLDITVSFETATVSDLRKMLIGELEQVNATVLGMYVGDRQIDGAENELSILLKEIPGLATDRKIVCKAGPKTSGGNSHGIIAGCAGVLGALSGPAAVQTSVAAAGFGAQGIVAGTPAAAYMASHGGMVAAGSACSVLQSIGAAGLGMGGVPLAAAAGGFLAYQAARALLGQNSSGSRNDENINQGAPDGEPAEKPSLPEPAGNPSPAYQAARAPLGQNSSGSSNDENINQGAPDGEPAEKPSLPEPAGKPSPGGPAK